MNPPPPPVTCQACGSWDLVEFLEVLGSSWVDDAWRCLGCGHCAVRFKPMAFSIDLRVTA